MHKLDHTGFNTLGTGSIHKIPKVRVRAPRLKVTGSKFYAHAHLPLMGSPQAQIGHNDIKNLATAPSMIHEIPKLKVTALRSKIREPKFHAHAHLPLKSGPHTQYGKVT